MRTRGHRKDTCETCLCTCVWQTHLCDGVCIHVQRSGIRDVSEYCVVSKRPWTCSRARVAGWAAPSSSHCPTEKLGWWVSLGVIVLPSPVTVSELTSLPEPGPGGARRARRNTEPRGHSGHESQESAPLSKPRLSSSADSWPASALKRFMSLLQAPHRPAEVSRALTHIPQRATGKLRHNPTLGSFSISHTAAPTAPALQPSAG